MPAKWIHILGVADSSRAYLHKDAQYIRCDRYRGPAQEAWEIHHQAPANQGLQLVIGPQAGPAPLRLGTKDLGGFFEGGLTHVRLWNRALNAPEISGALFGGCSPQGGWVAEFLLNNDTGSMVVDTARVNNRNIFNADSAKQR
jgi:hypothetical protein